MTSVLATLHGAISVVNAIACGKGATLGISLTVNTKIDASPGKGIIIEGNNKTVSHRLINETIHKIISKKYLEKTKLYISIESEIPIGYGLKSSSAISTSVALACAKLVKQKICDRQILLAGVNASIKSKVSLTGAFDDACACYYGGFMVTDNFKRKIIMSQKGQSDLNAILFIPKNQKRGNVKKLRNFKKIFQYAWNLAKTKDYWNAMILNGLATSSILNYDPFLVAKLVKNGALGASVSGNGPAIVAVADRKNINKIKKIFNDYEGKTIISRINNEKAKVREL